MTEESTTATRQPTSGIPSPIRVTKYGRRSFAVYEADVLLAVVCYRKGAEAVQNRIGGLQRRIFELEDRLRNATGADGNCRAAR